MLPKNAKIARSIEIIKFKSDGSPQKASTIEIYNNRLRKTITITPVSGRVLLKEENMKHKYGYLLLESVVSLSSMVIIMLVLYSIFCLQ